MRRVVAAVDLSPLGRRVAERGRMIAQTTGATMDLVHVVEHSPESFLGEAESQRLDAYRKKASDALKSWIESRGVCHPSLIVRDGTPATQVARIAKATDLTLFGSSSVDASTLGPVSRRLTRMLRGDVLVVRRQPRAPYRKAIAAVDLSNGSRLAVDLALALAPEASVTAVFALPARFDDELRRSGMNAGQIVDSRRERLHRAEEALKAFVSQWEGRVRPMVVDGTPSDALDEIVRRRGADLLTVGSRGQGGDSMVLLGGVAEDLLAAVPCDVGVARVAGPFRRV